MTGHEILLTVVDTAAITAGAIGVICSLSWAAEAIMEWIRVEFFEPEEPLEVIDEN